MLELIWFQNINVGSTGAQVLGTITAPGPGLHFVCEGGGAMKGIGTWTTAPVVRIGTNGPSTYNNIMPNQNLLIANLAGRNVAQNTLTAIPDGTAIGINVVNAGAVSAGSPRVDFYIAGKWIDVTTV